MKYKVVDGKNLDKTNEIANELEKLNSANEARLLLGNFILVVQTDKLNDKELKVTDLTLNKHSEDLGDYKLEDFIDKDYIRKVTRVLYKLDKRDNNINVTFSSAAEKFMNEHGISEQIKSTKNN